MKFMIRLFVFVLLIGAVAVLFLSFGTYSEGTRAGVVIKVSRKGFFFKTLEGQMNLQSFGAVKSPNAMAEVFDFSISRGDTAMYSVLERVSLTGERVNLHFQEKYARLPWAGDTKFFITKIDRMPEAKQEPRKDAYRD